MADVRVAVIGVGNVGSTFVKGLDYYGNGTNRIGLWHQKVAGLKPSNIKIVAAYDVDPEKVGNSISDVISQGSTTSRHSSSNVTVGPGIISDETGKYDRPATISPKEFTKELKDSRAQVALNLISSGLDKTS
ncbi:MAG TPA: hypothetical protein VJ742_10585, partial [Nitrososphaera sp.]|nr:hypothetical protein [Nitrososphaera sp.]